jgi:Tfp pilus assembly protein PilX
MSSKPQKLGHSPTPPRPNPQSGIVLLAVLVMLVVTSAWATYAWRQVFWQQRMLHSQGLEQMAWHAAEAGALALQHHIAHQLALNPSVTPVAALATIHGLHTLPGTPAAHWQLMQASSLVSTQANSEAVRIAISGHISDLQHSVHHIAQAQLLIDIEATSSSLHIIRWQRVYPR